MKRILILLALLLGAAGTGFAQTRTVSLPDTSGVPGTVLRLPVSVAGIIASDGVTSSQFTFTFPDSQFEWVGVTLQGSLLELTGSVQSNAQLKRVALASTDSLTSDGVLFFLDLRIRQNASKYSTHGIHFATAQLNEGTPAVITDNGSIRVKGISLQPGFVNNLLLTDTLAFSISGDGQAPYDWSVSNSSIATIDANGVLRPQTLGFVRVLVTDSQGLRDSTNMIRIQPSALANLTISMPDTSTRQTRVLRMPVRTTDLTGIGATSFETVVVYPSAAFTYLGIDTVGTNIGGGPMPVVHHTSNQIRVAYASDTPLSGAGDLFAIRFQVSHTYQGGATISFNEARFNEDLIPALDNSSVNILAAPPIILSPNPVHTTIGRSVDLNVTGSGFAPYSFQVETTGVVSESNGTLTGLTRGVTRVRAVDSEGFPSPWIPVQVFDIEARLPDTTVVFPDTMRLPIHVEPLNGLGIHSIEAIVRYDTTLFRFLEVQTTAITAGMTIETERIGSDIRVALAGTDELTGTGDVIQLSFIPRPGIGNLVRMPVSLVRFRFNEASDSTATAQLFNGGITNDWDWTAPSAPQNLTAEYETSTGVRLNWSAPEDDGGRPINDYLIEYRDTTMQADMWTLYDDGVSTDTTALVTGLAGRKLYLFRVAAQNSIGRGDASEADSTEWGFTEPGVPQQLVVVPEPGSDEGMRLKWMAPDDDGGRPILGYEIEYKESSSLEWIQFSGSDEPDTVAVILDLLPGATYDFRVAARNEIGTGLFTTPVSATDIQADRVYQTALLGNFPNPFNPSTVIRYELSVSGNVRLAVYDVLGRQVAILADGTNAAGSHQVRFDAANLASGLYVYRLEADGRVFTKTLMLVK
jgi:hypothetical protein